MLPGDPGYDRARAVWNATADAHPAVVARCAGTEDVVAAVRFARSHDLLVAVRGGGHSYPLRALGPVLVALKRTWDPANVLRRNQNIRPG